MLGTAGLLAVMALWPAAAKPENPMEEFRSRLAGEAWRSVELVVDARRTHLAPTLKEVFGDRRSWVDRYIESDDGRRYYDARWAASRERTARRVGYTNGYWDFAEVWYRDADSDKAQQFMLYGSFMNEARSGGAARPVPLCYLTVGLTPLADALEAGDTIGEGRVLGRPCVRWLFAGVEMGRNSLLGDPSRVKPEDLRQDLEFSLDRATGLPLKVEGIRKGRRLWCWEALSFDRVGGYHLARKSRLVQSNDLGPWMSTEYEVRVAKFDRDYPNALFWPERLDRLMLIATFGDYAPRGPSLFPPPVP